MISFIVPAHNEARGLATTLASLHTAARECGRHYEIMVVDDASTDGTGAIAVAAGARSVRVEHRHIAATRNAGARAARGSLLVFVDGDTLLPPGTLRAALAALAAGAAGGGATLQLVGPLPVYQRLATGVIARLLRIAGIAPGCFVYCTRRAFEAAGGFDEGYYAGEDVAMSRALARQGRFVVLREPVWSSPRKLQTFTIREHLRLMLRVAWHGRRVLRSREALDLWYAPRREVPPARDATPVSPERGRTPP